MLAQRTDSEVGHVLVVDDDDGLRQSIAHTLSSVGYSVEAFPSADVFLSHAISAEPTTVLIDFLLPGMTGLDLCREIIARNLPCTFSVISGHADVPSAVEAMKLGAVDLLEKPFGRQRLLEVVKKALDAAHHRAVNRAAEASTLQRLESLTPREREVFEAVASGLVTKEIARRLGISARTIDVHRSRIMQKLGIESPLQLASVLASLKSTRP